MEKNIWISQDSLQIPCKVFQPDDGAVQRIVLGVHGVGGCKEDAIQTAIAQEMEMFSAATFRFDFPCHGENPMPDGELTLEKCKDTLFAVVSYAREQYPQVEDLCIFATGFGAYITLLTLDRLTQLPGQVRLVIQTPSVHMDQTVLKMKNISRETLWAMDSVTVNGTRPFPVSYALFEQMRENPALEVYPIPFLILQGEEDDYIPMADIRLLRQLNDRAKLVIIPGTSHRFLEDGAWDMVLDLTRDWFEWEQVLLCDWE